MSTPHDVLKRAKEAGPSIRPPSETHYESRPQACRPPRLFLGVKLKS